jgi:hypothetical protein
MLTGRLARSAPAFSIDFVIKGRMPFLEAKYVSCFRAGPGRLEWLRVATHGVLNSRSTRHTAPGNSSAFDRLYK